MVNERLEKHILVLAQAIDSSEFESRKESNNSIKKASIKSLVIGGSRVNPFYSKTHWYKSSRV